MEKGKTKHALWSFLKLFLKTSTNQCKLSLLPTVIIGENMYFQYCLHEVNNFIDIVHVFF